MEMKTQLRGHCQCCGRDQAVKNGRMAHHGYEVKNHWFVGVCSGHNFAPIERERDTADSVIAACRQRAVELDDLAGRYERGEAHPERIPRRSWRRSEPKDMPWEDGDTYEQRDALQSAAWSSRQHAKANREFAARLEKIADEFHGKPLLEVERAAGPAPILIGEQRKTKDGKTLTVYRVDGARIYYRDDRSFQSRTSSRAWRGFELA